MKKGEGNMEDFLRDKLSSEYHDVESDWPAFEQKLDRALFFKQMRVGAVLSVLLIILSMAFFGGTGFLKLGRPTAADAPHNDSYQGVGSHHRFDATIAYQAENKEPANTQRQSSGATTKRRSLQKSTISDPLPKTLESNKRIVPTAKVSPLALAQGAASTASGPATVARSTPRTTTANSSAAIPPTEKAHNMVAQSNEPATQQAVIANLSPKPMAGIKGKPAGNTGFSLVPDGKEGSNYKPNARPTALLFDMNTVNTLQLREPVIPVNLRPSKPKEAYVSPMQEKRPWSYSIKVYPNFTYRKFVVAPNKMAYIHRDFVDQVKVAETGGFSMNVGFEASRRIGRITYLNGGIEYISYKTEANFDFTNYRDALINKETGEIHSYHIRNEPEQVVISDANRYHYLNFPLSIAYKPWATDHVRINIEGGGSYMYFVTASGQSLDYQTLDVIDLADRDYRNSIASVFMKVGVSYYVSPQFSLGFEPTVVYFTNTIYTEEYPFEVIPYSVGVNFKLQMKLN